MPDILVGVAWVEQQTLYYCGPATIEMLLVTLNVARPAAPPTWQERIWTDVVANTGATRPSGAQSTPTAPAFATQKCERCLKQWKCWATTPEVLEKLINQYQNIVEYTINRHSTDVDATTSLLDAIDRNVPVVALVRGWQHWVAVEGYRHNEAGSTSVGGRNLNGIFIRDPRETEQAVHYVTWDAWQDDYLDFVPCGFYEGSLVTLTGTRRPMPPAPSPPTGVRIVDQRILRRLPSHMVNKLITSEEAIRFAREAVSQLRGSTRLNPALAGADAQWATLVQRLDEFDSYYYIVAFTAEGRETSRVIVDARDGTLTEVTAVPERGKQLPPYVPSPVLKNRLAALGKRVVDELPYQPREGAIGEHPVAVWKPCGQSSSPFLPFYQYTIGDEFVYYRFDGERFDELTEGPA
jgi:hypothetical protein